MDPNVAMRMFGFSGGESMPTGMVGRLVAIGIHMLTRPFSSPVYLNVQYGHMFRHDCYASLEDAEHRYSHRKSRLRELCLSHTPQRWSITQSFILRTYARLLPPLESYP